MICVGPIVGAQVRPFRDQPEVNIKAAELMGKLYDSLLESGYSGHNLAHLLIRILFCLFAENTSIFHPRNLFLDFVLDRTREDGSDLGPWLAQLFQQLNTPEDQRFENLDEDLAKFPYVNGPLFKEQIPIPQFDRGMRERLIEACSFNWDAISPVIFGGLFQSVMDKVERRAKGAHYTSEKSILKVIEPLFLESLRDEFKKLKSSKASGRRKALEAFRERLGSMKVFDPACGCGNFLVIAYRELRELEIDVLKEIEEPGQFRIDLSLLNVDQFYGIEIDEFPSQIAQVSMWMMDHLMNLRMEQEFGSIPTRIPLTTSPNIFHADALETDWHAFLPADECTYVIGNPPYLGSKYQTNEQRLQVRQIANLGGSGGTLDYVTAWFLKAAEYVNRTGSTARVAFVATSSITQGEQVAQLWPLMFERYGIEIVFGHRTFVWQSEARGKAHVHVVIIGFAKADDIEPKEKRLLYSYPDPKKGDPVLTRHEALTPYLFDASELADRHQVVREVSRPINGLPRLLSGSQPIDGGHYIFTEGERAEFLQEEPGAEPYLRPYVGAEEFLYGKQRWILALQNAPPTELKSLKHIRARIQAVREYRLKSQRKSTLKIADFPTTYNVEVIPNYPFLVVPEVSSEKRRWIPIAWMEPPVIPSNLVRILPNADVYTFGILTSTMHMAWMREIGGRLKSDFRYAIGLVYNTFPMPTDVTAEGRRAVEDSAGEVLAARARHDPSCLAELYDPDLMPPDLLKDHLALDKAVDRLYRKEAFEADRDRVEFLFPLYERLAGGI